jgi:alpha-D-ribose 1-methylphosphonate 5-triphosphate synthase subunit PhnG
MPRLTGRPAVQARLCDLADNHRRNKRLQQAIHAAETACLHETQKLPRREKQAEMAKDNIDHFCPKLSAND